MAEATLTLPRRKMPISIFVAALLALVIAGQWFIWTGLFLMMLGAAAWSIVLVNLLLVTIGIDAWRRALPRWMMAVPILAYGGNLAASGLGYLQYLEVKNQVARQNATTALAFNPAREAVVTDDQTQSALVSRYQLPVAFVDTSLRTGAVRGRHWALPRPDTAQPGQYLAARLWLQADCAAVDVTDRIQVRTQPVQVGRMPLRNACLLETREETTPPLVTSRTSLVKRENLLLDTTLSTVRVTGPDGAVATRVYGTGGILLPIPVPVIGCGLNDADSRWDCVARLLRWPLPLGVAGKTSADEPSAAALASALGLKPRTIRIAQRPSGPFDWGAAEVDEAETTRVSGDHAPVLALINRLQAQRTNEAIARLGEVLAGGHAQLGTGFGATLAPHADLVAGQADALMTLFEGAVARDDGSMIWEVGQVIAALPPSAFGRISGRLIALAPHAGWFGRVPTLLVRLGDAAPASGPVLRQALVAPDRRAAGAAILGYCRAGRALPEAVQAIVEEKQRAGRNIEVGEASYVAFLRLGRPDLAVVPPRGDTGWFDRVRRTVTPAAPRSVCRIGSRVTASNLPNAAWLD